MPQAPAAGDAQEPGRTADGPGRADAGRLPYHPRRPRPGRRLRLICATSSARSSTVSHSSSSAAMSRSPLDAPHPVQGTWDAARVDQVVTNLISNALKYGAGRPIEVSVHAETSTGHRHGPRPRRRDPGRRTEQGLRSVHARRHRQASCRPRPGPVDCAPDRAGERRPHHRGEPAGSRVDVYRGVAAVTSPGTRSR